MIQRELKCTLYVEYMFSFSLIVFELIKQHSPYEIIFELPYSAEYPIAAKEKRTKFVFSLDCFKNQIIFTLLCSDLLQYDFETYVKKLTYLIFVLSGQ
jgi:hypothetical protein